MWRKRNEIDLVHSFGRLAALLPVLPLRRLPKIQSYQRPRVPWKGVTKALRLARESLCFTACSTSLYRERTRSDRHSGAWHTIYNGVDLGKYTFVPRVEPNAPLVFLGRLEPMKGAHVAIAIARSTGRSLVIAGDRVHTAAERDYFEVEIAPHLDGNRIRYIGPVDDVRKNALLGSSAALLFPTFWQEAFGIVMVEAMACGTPVIGFARGGVPEVVRDEENGYLCATVEEAIEAVARLERVDRKRVRADCEARFSARVIVDAYEKLYDRMVAACRAAR